MFNLPHRETKVKMTMRLFFHSKGWQVIKKFNKTLLETNKKTATFIPITTIITEDITGKGRNGTTFKKSNLALSVKITNAYTL